MEKQSKWTQKYKNSIDCNNPKGFSQKAHCQGLKKRKKSKASILVSINRIAMIFENENRFDIADELNAVFHKLANKFKPSYEVPFPMNLDDALNTLIQKITKLILMEAGKTLNQFLISGKKLQTI